MCYFPRWAVLHKVKTLHADVFFLPHPSSPARRGSTSLLNPPFSEGEDLKPGRPGLYEQTSSRPKGLLVIAYAIELRLFIRLWRPCG